MRYPVNLPELPGRRIEVEVAGVFSSPKLLVDGQPANKGAKRGQFLVCGADGRDVTIGLKTSLDPIPKVLVAGRTIRLADPLTWYQWIWSAVPLVLVGLGGALGGALGGLTLACNVRILRSDINTAAKYALTLMLSLGALGAYVFFASMFLSAVHAK